MYFIYNQRHCVKIFEDFYKTVYLGWFSWAVVESTNYFSINSTKSTKSFVSSNIYTGKQYV